MHLSVKLQVYCLSSLTTNYEPVGLFYDLVWYKRQNQWRHLSLHEAHDLLYVNNQSFDNFEAAQSFRSYRSED
jgi:hypothetical protein